MCVSAQAAAIQSAGRRKGSDARTVLAKHCPSSDAFLTSPNRPGGVLEKPIWAVPLKQETYRESALLRSCPGVLKGSRHLLMPNPLIFLKTLIRSWLRNPELAKKKKKTALEDSKRGLMDGAYGNYSLIYHLGRGD